MRTCPATLISRVVLCPQLVLRKWSELIPGGEFRCFVKENKLIGKNSSSSPYLGKNVGTPFCHIYDRHYFQCIKMKPLNCIIGGRIIFTKQVRTYADGYVPVKCKINCYNVYLNSNILQKQKIPF